MSMDNYLSKNDCRSPGNKVTYATFLKWCVEARGIAPRVERENGKDMVVEVHCKLCAKHINKIRGELKGQALDAAENYAVGTAFVTKHNVDRHLDKSRAHKAAMDFEKLEVNANESSSRENVRISEQQYSQSLGNQTRIDTLMHKNARDAYEKLLKTAYMLAVDGGPLSSFSTLVKVQKANGVRLITGHDNGHAAQEFVHEIAQAIREKLALILCSVGAFSILSDGSQARKTGKEKELVLIRVVRGEGVPLYYCVALAEMSNYGDATAENLKDCLDDIFLRKLEIPEDRYSKLLVSMTADGASVNFGNVRGLLTRMQNDDRPWLLKIHCVSHRLELAIKDSLLKEIQFEDVKDFMQTIYYLFKQSGKVKEHFANYGATILGATVYIFPKVSGTRFVAHVRRGLHHLLHNWGILLSVCENILGSSDTNMRGIKPKLQGIRKKLRSGSFFITCAVLKQLLDILTELSLKLEKGSIKVFDMQLFVEKTKDDLKELLESDMCENIFTTCLSNLGISVESVDLGNDELEVEWRIPKKHHNRRKPENREYATVTAKIPGVKAAHVIKNAELLRARATNALCECFETRFSSFEDEIYSHMSWLDPANWYNPSVEVQAIISVANHFSVTLAQNGFEPSQLKKEWSDLQRTVRFHYPGVQADQLWQNIFEYRKESFPNICKVVEIVLCLGPSNSIVEKGFSQLTYMLSDRRLGLLADSMEDLLLIKVNNLTWTTQEREEIVQRALEIHMQKRRQLAIDSVPFSMMAAPPSKRVRLTETETQGHETDEILVADDMSNVIDLDATKDAPPDLDTLDAAATYFDFSDNEDDLNEADDDLSKLETDGLSGDD